MANLFSELLQAEIGSSTTYNNICLISREALDDTCVTLPCSHKYNYYSIYRELINQRKTRTRSKPKIQCPYCRTTHNYVLPYIDMPGVKKIQWVNLPTKYQLLPHKCTYVFKSNSSKVCNKSCMNTMCQYHTKILSGSAISEEQMASLQPDTNLLVYNVAVLRSIAKFYNIKKYSTLKKTELVALIQQSII